MLLVSAHGRRVTHWVVFRDMVRNPTRDFSKASSHSNRWCLTKWISRNASLQSRDRSDIKRLLLPK